VLVDPHEAPDLPGEALRGLEHFTTAAAVALENATLYEKLQQLAIMDGLTGAHNHRHFQESLRKEIARAERYCSPFSLLMLDLDNFKRFNDTLGHQAGDAVLIQVARVLKMNTRKVDTVARYGGEEFAVLLPGTDKAGAVALADRLREAVSTSPADVASDAPWGRVTASVGVSTWGEDGGMGPALIRAADEALYLAKAEGRDCVRGGRA
jgi:diguanylate cyclase (GGDEF)-like protein